MSFRRIEYFLSVAKHLNFTKAARECYVAQAAISQQIKQFEQELGFALFDRGGTSVKLTPAGEFFANQCRSIMAQYNGAVKQARAIVDGERKRLRVGFRGPCAGEPFTWYLRQYRQEHPEASVRLREGRREVLMEDLLKGELDMLVIPDYGMPLDERFDTIELGSRRSKFMIGPDSPLAGRRSISSAELTGQTILRMEGAGQEDNLQQRNEYYVRLGLGSNPMRSVKSYFETVLAVEAGLGIAAVPSGAESQLPKDITVFEIEGDTFRESTVAVRQIPPVSVAADDFFRLVRREQEREAEA